MKKSSKLSLEQRIEKRFSTPEEILIRKKWLLCTLINWVVAPLVAMVILILCDNREEYIYGVFGSLAGFLTLYLYTYKGRGTKWLTFALVVGGLCRASGIIKELKSTSHGYEIFGILGALVLYVWWFQMSLKLRKVNSEFNKRRNEAILSKID